MIDTRYYKHLAQLFSPPIIREIASEGTSGLLKSVLEHSGYERRVGATLAEVFEGIYGFLRRHYRSEYIYKNALANKILLARHSLTTSTLLTEFSTGRSKADLVIINGSSTVYEVKTELDSLERLQKQMEAYLRVFDYVYVVTHDSRIKKLNNLLSEQIGIILLSDKYTLRTVRVAKSNKQRTDAGEICDCLRQNEYCDIIAARFGSVPKVPNTRFYTECRALFSQLSPEEAHHGMVRVLRKRSSDANLIQFVGAVPHSLKLSCLISRLTPAQRASFLTTLSSIYI